MNRQVPTVNQQFCYNKYMEKSIYAQTAEIYNKLGKKYLIESKKITPPERLPFSKLFLKGSHILDVGCGGGRDAKFFIQKGLNVTGIDTSSVLIKLAQKEVPKATFKYIDLLKIQFPKNTFDGIWAQAVLFHLKRKDVPIALKKFYKILKQNGTLHITIREGKGEEYIKDQLSDGNERFYTYFSKNEIETLLKNQGFKIIFFKISKDVHKRKNISWMRIWAVKN